MLEIEGTRPASGRKRFRIVILIASGLAVIGCGVLLTVFWLRPAMRLAYVDSAISTLRILVNAEERFATAHPDWGYACEFSDLDLNELAQGFVRSSQRNGYAFALVCATKNGDAAHRGFQVAGRPLASHMAAYCADQSGVVRYDEGGSTERCLKTGISW